MVTLSAEPLKEGARNAGQALSATALTIVPAAKDTLAIVPNTVSGLQDRIASTRKLTKRATTIATAGVIVAAVGATAAVVGHLVFHAHALGAYNEARRQRKAEARWEEETLDVFAQAMAACAAPSFEELYAAGPQADETGLLSAASEPGCYAILRFDEGDDLDDLLAYRDVYVGCGQDMAAAAHEQLSGAGNLYVHADVVYGQPLQVVFFPCEAPFAHAYREQLVDALGAQASYNRIAGIEEAG